MRGGVVSRIDTLEANLNINDNTTNVGNSSNKLLLKGMETRPSYNNDSTQLALKSDVDSVASSIKNHTDNKSNPHGVTKAQVGLGNVDNTSDADKPISTATQAALDKKQGKLTAGTGITIDANNKINGTNYWTLSDTTLSPVSEVNTVSCSAINSPSSSLTLSGKDGVEILANGTKYLDIKSNGVFMPNLSTSSVSADQPILFTKREDGWITKASKITGNPVTGELKATKVTTTGAITCNSITLPEGGDINVSGGQHLDITAMYPRLPNIQVTTTNTNRPILLSNIDNALCTTNVNNVYYNGSTETFNLKNCNVTGTLQKGGVDVATTTDVSNATSSCAKTGSANTFTGLNTFTGTIKANSIMDNVNNQVIKGSSFRLAAGKYTLQTILKMVFTTIPSNYMVTINCPSGNMTTKDEDIGTYEKVHCWNYDSAGYQAADYYNGNNYVHDEGMASTDSSQISVTCTNAIQVIISC